MKYLHYTLICLLGLILGGCSDTFESESLHKESRAMVVGDKVILTASCDVSGFKDVSTRGFTDTPTLDDLNLYIIEFVDNGSPLTNTLSAVYRPSKETVDGTVVKYDVTINKTDQPRILHFLAVADDNLQIPNGVESSVMPGLTSENSQDAYWRRLVFPTGYCVRETYDGNKERWVINQDLKDKLVGDETTGPKNIKLIRNFSKITVGIDPNITFNDTNTTGFTLEGFLVVNTPLKGTMVPYSSIGREFPEFLDESGNPLPYQTVFQKYKYKGISPANTTLGNQVTSEDAPEIPVQTLKTYTTNENGTTKTWNCLESQYMYERPFSSISRTFVIVRGTYHNRITNPDDVSSYYKLDLGANDANGIFRYYGLLRNFNFFIRITGVGASGYGSASAAAEGTVYNNISFDIDTDNLLNLSDGSDIIKVNFTTAVITKANQTLDFQYAYKAGIMNSNNGTFNNTLANVIGLEPGNVIKSVTKTGDGQTGTNPVNPWTSYKIVCEDPTAITQTQEFTIVNSKTGLGRTVTLVSHLKWDFENLCEYAGIWENYPATYQGLHVQNPISLNDATYNGKCGTNMGSQFTIFFDIPDNIPEALFPLEFTIESNLQGLENEPMGTIVVAPGPSLFPDNNGENRIQYRKSVTWTEYNTELKMNVRDDNGTALGDPNDGPVTHRVRCRFRTIETVDPTEVTVLIDNLNFNIGTVKFNRVASVNGVTGPGLVIN